MGKLSLEAAGTSHLLASKMLEKNNNVTVARFINKSLGNYENTLSQLNSCNMFGFTP